MILCTCTVALCKLIETFWGGHKGPDSARVTLELVVLGQWVGSEQDCMCIMKMNNLLPSINEYGYVILIVDVYLCVCVWLYKDGWEDAWTVLCKGRVHKQSLALKIVPGESEQGQCQTWYMGTCSLQCLRQMQLRRRCVWVVILLIQLISFQCHNNQFHLRSLLCNACLCKHGTKLVQVDSIQLQITYMSLCTV